MSVAAILLPILVFAVAPSSWAASSGVVCLLTEPETGACRLEARWEQGSNGQVLLTVTTGGSGHLQQCVRPWRTVADSGEGPAIVDCHGGETLGWYSRQYDCYFRDVTNDFGGVLPSDVVYKEGTQPGDDGALYLVQCYLVEWTIRCRMAGKVTLTGFCRPRRMGLEARRIRLLI